MFYYKNNKVHPILQKMVYRLLKEIELEDVFENMGDSISKKRGYQNSQMKLVMEQQRQQFLLKKSQDWDLNQLKVVQTLWKSKRELNTSMLN